MIRGAPIINDVTMGDIDGILFPSNVEIVDNGSDAPGTLLNECSFNFKEIFNSVDMIIAKGQGNYETLYPANREKVYSLLTAKCSVLARHLACKKGDMHLIFHD